MENQGLNLCRVGGGLIFDNRYNRSGARLTITPDRRGFDALRARAPGAATPIKGPATQPAPFHPLAFQVP
jgi:hypothetical protein